MMRCFIPRQWRLQYVLYALILIEFPFTVANLALFGIASPNLYRSILRSEGAKMGFNSDGLTELYAAANYRPVKTPVVWSNFNTQYNLVIGVLTMFFFLIKSTLVLMHVFYPIISFPLHCGLLAIWAVSISIQTGKDTIDPKHINNGAPWFITKNCNIVKDGTIRGYCMQAKSAFAVSVIMLSIMALFVLLSAYSLWPTKEARLAHQTRLAEKKAEKEKYATSPYDNEMTSEEQWQHMWELQQLPRTPGTVGGMKSPMTPRTKAFDSLGGGGGNVDVGGYYAQDIPQTPVSPVQYQQYNPQTHLSPVQYEQYQPQQYKTPQEQWRQQQVQQQMQYDELIPDNKGKGTAY